MSGGDDGGCGAVCPAETMVALRRRWPAAPLGRALERPAVRAPGGCATRRFETGQAWRRILARGCRASAWFRLARRFQSAAASSRVVRSAERAWQVLHTTQNQRPLR